MDSPFCSLISGATAGLAVDLGLYPLDTLKTRLQSHEGFQKSGGFRSLYRGMSSVALGSAPGSALFFLTYTTLDSYWHCESSWCDAARACCGEFAACLVRVPTEVVKQNAQVSSKRSALKITVDLWRQSGFRAFYRGFTTTLAREIPFAFVEYPLWEYLKKRIAKDNQRATPIQSAFCGSIAGVVAAGLTTPLDVAKTRIMLSTQQLSMLQVLVQIAQRDGYCSLFAGIAPRCAWMGIGGYIYFFAYEQAMHMMRTQNASSFRISSVQGRTFSSNKSGVDVTFKIASGDFTVKDAPIGDTILDVVINNDVPIEGYGACEGTLACSTCHVILEPEHFERCGKISENELDILDYASQLYDRSRLGCQVKIIEADKPAITLTVPSERRDARTI
ncbi:putative carrier protein PET8 [Aphelenchoides besseyi]|nr:putative carrier protein PET8 [Aphelenchoides besseyi]